MSQPRHIWRNLSQPLRQQVIDDITAVCTVARVEAGNGDGHGNTLQAPGRLHHRGCRLGRDHPARHSRLSGGRNLAFLPARCQSAIDNVASKSAITPYSVVGRAG